MFDKPIVSSIVSETIIIEIPLFDLTEFSFKQMIPSIKLHYVDNIDLIKKFYGYSYTKAKDVVDILSEDQIEHIRSKLDTGGLRKE